MPPRVVLLPGLAPFPRLAPAPGLPRPRIPPHRSPPPRHPLHRPASVGRAPRLFTGVVFFRLWLFFRSGVTSWMSGSSSPSLPRISFLFRSCCSRGRTREGPPSSGLGPAAGSSFFFLLSSGCGPSSPGWTPSGSSLRFDLSSCRGLAPPGRPSSGSSLFFCRSSRCGLAPPGCPSSGRSSFFFLPLLRNGPGATRLLPRRIFSFLPAFLPDASPVRLGRPRPLSSHRVGHFPLLRLRCMPWPVPCFSSRMRCLPLGRTSLSRNRRNLQPLLLLFRDASVLLVQVIKERGKSATLLTSETRCHPFGIPVHQEAPVDLLPVMQRGEDALRQRDREGGGLLRVEDWHHEFEKTLLPGIQQSSTLNPS